MSSAPKLSPDPANHPTECRCTACVQWYAERGVAMPWVDEPEDEELEPAAEDEDSE